MIAICREVDKATGRVAVYPLNEEITDLLLFNLKMRALLNPELRYFVTARVRWEGVWQKDIISVLKRKTVTPEAIKLLGGIVEL